MALLCRRQGLRAAGGVDAQPRAEVWHLDAARRVPAGDRRKVSRPRVVAAHHGRPDRVRSEDMPQQQRAALVQLHVGRARARRGRVAPRSAGVLRLAGAAVRRLGCGFDQVGLHVRRWTDGDVLARGGAGRRRGSQGRSPHGALALAGRRHDARVRGVGCRLRGRAQAHGQQPYWLSHQVHHCRHLHRHLRRYCGFSPAGNNVSRDWRLPLAATRVDRRPRRARKDTQCPLRPNPYLLLPSNNPQPFSSHNA